MRLIDADALLDGLNKEISEDEADAFKRPMSDTSPSSYLALAIAKHVIEYLKQAPTVDAVPVVRCQNCTHHGHCGYEDVAGWYCADGEREEQHVDKAE